MGSKSRCNISYYASDFRRQVTAGKNKISQQVVIPGRIGIRSDHRSHGGLKIFATITPVKGFRLFGLSELYEAHHRQTLISKKLGASQLRQVNHRADIYHGCIQPFKEVTGSH